MSHQTVIVLDFGGQYNQLIARRVRECGVYCEIVSYRVGLEAIRAENPKGIIFTGGPNSVYTDGAPTIDPAVFELGIPVLGLCYGCQLMMHLLGGHVCKKRPAPVYKRRGALHSSYSFSRGLRCAARHASICASRSATRASLPCSVGT